MEREQQKVGQMVKLLNEDNEQLKSQLKEDSALIESSNQIIKKLRQALEEYLLLFPSSILSFIFMSFTSLITIQSYCFHFQQ